MDVNLHLLAHNIVSIGSFIVILGTVIFTYIHGTRRATNVALSLAGLSAAVFALSHVIGANLADPYLSREALMFNLAIFFLGVFYVHTVLAFLGKDRAHSSLLALLYIAAVSLSVFFLLNPDLFLLPSIPKMYFPNYYHPGTLNWVRMAFLYGICIPYVIYLQITAYRQAKLISERRQHLFFLYATIVGFGLGFIPNLLVYDIPVDPLWGMLFGLLFAVPFIYGAVRYNLFNIQVIAKQAFGYAVAVGIMGGLISLLNYSNIWLDRIFPNFPLWTTAFVSSLMAVTAAVYVWRRLRENDILKYEFITTVTHKFRTPLTHIKWATDNLADANLPESEKMQIGYIQSANMKLVELTNLLVNMQQTEGASYAYRPKRSDLSVSAGEVLESLQSQVAAKNLVINKELPAGLYSVYDVSRIKFVIQVLIENAISYTPKGGGIIVTTRRHNNEVICKVRDTGMGLTAEELDMLFSTFYRGNDARTTDTEGMGIGLYVAKEIVTRHGGRIWAESEGPKRGSTFSFSLPVAE